MSRGPRRPPPFWDDPLGLVSEPRWASVRAECVRRIGERLAQSLYAGTCKAWCYMGTGRFTEYRFYWLFNFGPHTDYRLPL